MKTIVTFVIFLLFALEATAQNAIVVNFDSKSVAATIKLDAKKPVQFRFKNCKELPDNARRYTFSVGTQKVKQDLFDCTTTLSLEVFKTIEKYKAPAKVSFIVWDGSGWPAFQIDYEIEASGNAKMSVVAGAGKKNTGVQSDTIPKAADKGQKSDSLSKSKDAPSKKLVDSTEFVPQAYLKADDPMVGTSCFYPRVEYNLCCPGSGFKVYNTEKDKADGKPKSYLLYRTTFQKNQGVHFFYYNANLLKYDLGIATNYEMSSSTVPALYNTLFTLMMPKALTQSGVADPLAEQLGKIIKLNTDLKAFLKKQLTAEDCIDLPAVEQQKKVIFKRIESAFKVGSPEQFNQSYVEIKEQLKKSESVENVEFNELVKEKYSLKTTPDSIVIETKKLIEAIDAIGLSYYYIVPQLQNADAITFTLNVKPKEGGNGTKHITAEPITVPLRGGWKVDFSTGFYYSSVRNQEYSLKDVMRGDSVIAKSIVSERGDKNGRGAFGVTAQANIYPRLGTVQPAVTVGLGGSLDLNYSFLLGGGLVIGKSNRFMLSGGWNLSSRKVLSDKYDDVASGQGNLPKSTTTLDTRNALKSGFFLSLTYSLSLNIKKQQASSTEESEEKKEK